MFIRIVAECRIELFPKGLTYYCDFDMRVHEIYWRLSGLYWEIGNEDMAKRQEAENWSAKF